MTLTVCLLLYVHDVLFSRCTFIEGERRLSSRVSIELVLMFCCIVEIRLEIFRSLPAGMKRACVWAHRPTACCGCFVVRSYVSLLFGPLYMDHSFLISKKLLTSGLRVPCGVPLCHTPGHLANPHGYGAPSPRSTRYGTRHFTRCSTRNKVP